MKKVLFVSIGFYDYDYSIINQFNKMNYDVDYYSEVPKETLKSKLYKRIKRTKEQQKIVRKHTNNIVTKSGVNYDLVFVIKCENLSTDDILGLKRKSPNAKFILYLWDSLKRISNIKEKLHLFDKVYSFDRLDCLSDVRLNFNPLFYREEYNNKNNEVLKYSYDIYHLGWYHSDRLKIIKQISKFISDNNLKDKLIIYTGYFNFLIQSIIGGDLRGNKKHLIFKSISSKNNFDNIKKSKTILDIAHPLQNGLTMRTIELVGMQKKIITTNKDIVNYDFYNPNNVWIIDRNNPYIDLSFFDKAYIKIPEDIRSEYSISKWLFRMIH